MKSAYAYIPSDRRQMMAQGRNLPEVDFGSVLFADISGFTALADGLARQHGSRRGADELTRQINQVYSALIHEVDRFGGSVIGFAGDAITCWFGNDGQTFQEGHDSSALHAVASALAMQQAMKPLAKVKIGATTSVQLAIKTAVASGNVRRFVVGDPAIQLIDVLAGTTLDRMAAAEHLAQTHELLIDEATAAALGTHISVREWRSAPNQSKRYALVTALADWQHTPSIESETDLVDEEALQAWVLPAIRQKLMEQSGRFLAELRPATSLFLRFAGLDFDEDNEAGTKLDQFIRHVQRVIHRYEAALVQLTTGDKGSYLYVAFGAPIAHDDDARRAIVAALELRNSQSQFPFLTSLQIGISQGAMRVGPYGSDHRQTYGVLGEEVNMAARLMTHAAPSQILVSKVVYEATTDDFLFDTPQHLQLKGRSEPQTVYTVLGRQSRIASHLQRLYEEPLAAREHELAQMQQSLSQMLAGSGRILRIEGSAGVGKSHLVAAFMKGVDALGISSVAAICQSTERETAYHAVRQITRTLFKIDSQMDEATVVARIEESVRNSNPNLLLRLPLLGEIIGIEIPDNPTIASLDPKLRQEALQSLAVELLQSGARRSPLVLLAEDVHWMDEASQSLLLALARVIESAPILLLVVHRPGGERQGDRETGRQGAGEQREKGEGEKIGFLAELEQVANQDLIRLEELPPSGTIQLVSQRLRGTVAPLTVALIQAQAQGNPFFTEELVDALRESERLVEIDGVWTLSAETITALQAANCLLRDGEEWQLRPDAPLSSVDLGVPNSIQGVILSRLDRLPESVKPTSKVASVIGRLFEFDLLVRAHPLHIQSTQVGKDVNTLVERDFARIERPDPSLAYIFKHNITQEVAYNTLLENQRREIHQSVAVALEDAQPDAIDRLAFHFYNGDLSQTTTREKALHYLDRAATRAQRDYANETALSYLNRALQLEQRRQWLKAKVEVLDILGRREQQEETLRQLTELVGEDDFETLLLWGKYYESVSEYERAKEAVERALNRAHELTNGEKKARCLNQLGMVAWRQGEYEVAGDAYIAALSEIAMRGNVGDEIKSEAHYGLGLVYRQQGKYDEAKVEFTKDLKLSNLRNDRIREARALNALGILELIQHKPQNAIEPIQRSIEIRSMVGDRVGMGRGILALAQSFTNIGDLAQSINLLSESLSIFQAVGDRWHEVTVWIERGIIYWIIGEFDQAETSLWQGLTLCRSMENESGEAYVLLNLGQVLRDRGKSGEAEHILLDGIALAQKQGDIDLIAGYESDLADLYLRVQDFEKAIDHAHSALKRHNSFDSLLEAATNFAILASAHLHTNQRKLAIQYMNKALKILETRVHKGIDQAQRDYWQCYLVCKALNKQQQALKILKLANQVMLTNTNHISQESMRETYLTKVPVNRHIREEMDRIDSSQLQT